MPLCCLNKEIATHEFNVFDCGACLSRKFGLDVVVLIGFLDLYVEDGGLAGLITDRSFLHLNYISNRLFFD